jgi:hypothetical protein
LLVRQHLTGYSRFLLVKQHLTGYSHFLLVKQHLTGYSRWRAWSLLKDSTKLPSLDVERRVGDESRQNYC